jgi:ATP-dependent DNA helicase RecG
VLGAAQSGGRNSLRLLRVVRDAELLASARDDARALIDSDPTLASSPALAEAIAMWLGEREEFLERT